MLWIGSGWVTLIGLGFDAAGFALLAWDILPEYRENRIARQLQRAADNAIDAPRDWAPWTGSNSPPKDDDQLASATAELEKIGVHLQWVEVMIAYDHLEDAARQLGKLDDPVVAKALANRQPFNNPEFAAALEAVRIAARERSAKLHHRPRPPLRFAIGLVVIGYLLQAWGSIPIS